MSMMGTLGKVAMGIIVAKGVGKIMGGGGSSSGGMGGLLGSLLGGGQQQSSGGIGDLLGGLMGGKSAGSQQSGGGLGGLGDLLGSLAGGSQSSDQSNSNSGKLKDFSAMFGDTASDKEPEPEQEAQAQLLLRAMISAAKADGQVDEAEQKKILEHLGDVSEDEAQMVRDELAAPLDLDALINDVPKGMEQQVYLMSLLAIDLDSKEEAVYLDKLAKGLNISSTTSNEIHDKLGAPKLYN
ncbi:MAG: hypothetical protein DSZ29_07615 [Aquificaceae bacterium]|nr:MAG: hypothetical protein DSZ29_07615 [Aquificaceae bacterium]